MPHSSDMCAPTDNNGIDVVQIDLGDSPVTTDNDEESDMDDENHMTIRAKWMFDDCAKIDDIVERLEQHILYYKQLKTEGWELTDPVNDDWGFMRRNLTQ